MARVFKNKKPSKGKSVKFTKVEQAIFKLACVVEENPLCEYNVKNIILDILGYELIP